MSNSIQDGNVVTVQAVGAVVVDQVLIVAELIGIALNNAAIGEDVELALTGVFSMVRANIAIAQGEALYHDGATITNVGTDKFIGHATKAYGAGVTPIEVRLAQTAA